MFANQVILPFFIIMVLSYGIYPIKKIINLQVVFNKILRRIWNLPFNSHTKIVQCVSRIESIGNLIYTFISESYLLF